MTSKLAGATRFSGELTRRYANHFDKLMIISTITFPHLFSPVHIFHITLTNVHSRRHGTDGCTVGS